MFIRCSQDMGFISFIFNAVYLWIQHYWLFILCLGTQVGTEDRSEKNNLSVSEKHTVYFLNKVVFNTMWRGKKKDEETE